MNSHDRPTVLVLAGCNGAGKTTFARYFCTEHFHIPTFVNADVIARGLSGFLPKAANVEAGRILLNRLDRLTERRLDFAFETTLAGRAHATRMRSLQETGYRVCLVYLWLADPSLNVARVWQRVQVGGHDVPKKTIRQRWTRSLENFFTMYLNYADVWEIYDNSSLDGPTLIARQGAGRIIEVAKPSIWQRLYLTWKYSTDSCSHEAVTGDIGPSSLTNSVTQELTIHKALGNRVASWDGEKVVWS
ncbi:MAG: zeta toxin family protein [Gemmataceae bacterium]